MVRGDRMMTTEKITVSKIYNLGNYQNVRFEMECSVPTAEVEDEITLNEYYGRACRALDRAFEANFKSK